MNAEEILLIRDIRRMFDRVTIDSSRVEVSVMRGYVTLRGTVTTLRSHPFVVVKEEFAELERRLRRDQRIKQLSAEVRIVQPKVHHHEGFAVPHFDVEEDKKDEDKDPDSA